jgi:hypothetical protein
MSDLEVERTRDDIRRVRVGQATSHTNEIMIITHILSGMGRQSFYFRFFVVFPVIVFPDVARVFCPSAATLTASFNALAALRFPLVVDLPESPSPFALAKAGLCVRRVDDVPDKGPVIVDLVSVLVLMVKAGELLKLALACCCSWLSARAASCLIGFKESSDAWSEGKEVIRLSRQARSYILSEPKSSSKSVLSVSAAPPGYRAFSPRTLTPNVSNGILVLFRITCGSVLISDDRASLISINWSSPRCSSHSQGRICTGAPYLRLPFASRVA